MGLFGSDDVENLLARRKYDKAIEVLKAQLRQSYDTRLRMQLGDALILSGRGLDAIPLLQELADDLAAEKQPAKAIALFKKIQKLDPDRADIGLKIAKLIQQKDAPPPKKRGWEPGTAGYMTSERVLDFGDGEEAQKPRPVPAAKPVSPPPAPVVAAAPPPRSQALPPPLAPEEIIEEFEVEEPAPPAVSPLFQSFSQEELVAVMRGLRLLTFQAGDIIISEGDPGDSLFVLTTGVAKAFIKNQGAIGQRFAREMRDGDFFGEIALLSGKARTATVTAATRCELLELDRPTLDQIIVLHPHVSRVLQDFYIERASH
jgi:Cyclic nucleotide-binding domain